MFRPGGEAFGAKGNGRTLGVYPSHKFHINGFAALKPLQQNLRRQPFKRDRAVQRN